MSFKYDVLGHVRFGYELNDILTLKGIEDIDSFLHPTIKHVESEELFDNIKKARDVYVQHVSQNHTIDLLVDCDVDNLEIGDPVEMVFRKIREDGEDGVISYGFKFRVTK